MVACSVGRTYIYMASQVGRCPFSPLAWYRAGLITGAVLVGFGSCWAQRCQYP